MAAVETYDVRDALRLFAAGTVAPTALMRAMASHDGWLVPAGLLTDLEDGRDDAKPLVIGTSDAGSEETLHLFTDVDAAMRASEAGLDLGAFVRNVPGTVALARLNPRFEGLEVNAASPAEARWSVRHRYFPMLRLWAQTLALERVLLETDVTAERLAAIQRYPAWLVLAEPDRQTPKAVHWLGDSKRCALAFTAIDHLNAWLMSGDVDFDTPATQARFRGEQMLDALRKANVDAVVINPASDDKVTIEARHWAPVRDPVSGP